MWNQNSHKSRCACIWERFNLLFPILATILSPLFCRLFGDFQNVSLLSIRQHLESSCESLLFNSKLSVTIVKTQTHTQTKTLVNLNQNVYMYTIKAHSYFVDVCVVMCIWCMRSNNNRILHAISFYEINWNCLFINTSSRLFSKVDLNVVESKNKTYNSYQKHMNTHIHKEEETKTDDKSKYKMLVCVFV